MSLFDDIGRDLRLNSAGAHSALRDAQRGALLAAQSHFTKSSAAAQLILPTGVGKTLIASLLPYALRSNRVLVVTPGRLLRGQLADEFRHQHRLREGGLLPAESNFPSVQVANRKATAEDWEAWREADVVIGTPAVLSPGYDGVAQPPADLFDLVVFDEAHHLPARTWTDLYSSLEAKAALLTATPFRNDGKRLPGEAAYVYPLRQAMDQGVFGEVKYVPIEPVANEDIDLTIARAVRARLNSAEHVEAESRVLVRAGQIADAESLVELYGGVGINLGLIDGRTSWTKSQAIRARVESGELDGFACVGAMTEGFDFPTLKIGAYHSPHKTLAPTIQFIGRLARASEITAELLAPRSAVSKETADLYREDTGWRLLLPALVDSANDHEREVREFVAAAEVEGELDISALSLHPGFSAQIYVTSEPPKFESVLDELAGARIVKRIVHRESKTLALITERRERPRFLRIDALDASKYELHLVTTAEAHGKILTFVSTSSKATLDELLMHYVSTGFRRLREEELRKVFSDAQFESMFSLGTRPTRANTGTSYQTRSGPRAERAITSADALGSTLGHGMGRSGDGTFGFSVEKSKVWKPEFAPSLFDFQSWCQELADAVATPEQRDQGDVLDMFPIAQHLEQFPDHPAALTLPTEVLVDYQISVDGEIVPPEALEFFPIENQSSATQVQFEMRLDETNKGSVEFRSDESVSVTGTSVVGVRRDNNQTESISSILSEFPATIYFADGHSVRGNQIMRPQQALGAVPGEQFELWDWSNADITKEFGEADADLSNVAATAMANLIDSSDFVIQDHGAGEIADFVTIRESDRGVELRLVHCKSSSSANPGARVEDVEELVAQSMRSVQWAFDAPRIWSEISHRLENRAPTQLKHGEQGELSTNLATWSEHSPNIDWSIWLVQPGISQASIEGAQRVRTLLAAADYWLAGQNARLKLACSP